MTTTRRFGLIGNPLQHSKSAEYFTQKFISQGLHDCRFDLFPILLDPQNVSTLLPQLIQQHHLLGFSVTIPYKQLVLPLLYTISPEAQAIGAVNSVKVDWSAPDPQRGYPFRLHGHNTDAPAFAQTLRPLLRPWHTQALILGTGGASLAVHYALKSMGIQSLFVSRSPELYNQSHPNLTQAISYSQAFHLSSRIFLIVNTTPLGTFPKVEATPWVNIRNLSPRHLCYDLVYNPEETRFLLESHLAGAQTQNGLPMLHLQADLSWAIWNSTN